MRVMGVCGTKTTNNEFFFLGDSQRHRAVRLFERALIRASVDAEHLVQVPARARHHQGDAQHQQAQEA
jgi:hypothetical protein